MQANDFTRFRAVLAGMAKLYERELDAPLLDAYWLALRDWSLSDFERAAAHLMGRSRFMPRPADFNDLRKASSMTAGEAWSAALAHARGAWRSGPAVSEVERAVQAIGGWLVLAHANVDSLQFIERRFADAFADLETAVATREALPSIAGPTATWKGRLSGPAPVGDLVGRLKGSAT